MILSLTDQWRIQGGGGGALFFDQMKKKLLETALPPFSKGLHYHLPPLSQGMDPAL